MNTWKTLYIKEIKDNRTLFVLLPSVTAFLELVAVLSFDDGQSVPSAHCLWSVVPYSFVLILPFLLIHSFTQEIKGQTHYLLLSLPVSRAQVFAAKAAAVTTLGLVLFALSTAGLIAVFSELRAFAPLVDIDMQSIPFTAMHIAVFTGACYLSALALMLGMAGGVAGLKLVVRRFAGLASAAFVLGVLYCYFGTLRRGFPLDRFARPRVVLVELGQWRTGQHESRVPQDQFRILRALAHRRASGHGNRDVAV